MFDWDRHNLRKIRAHQISREEAEEALLNDPVRAYEQQVEGEQRYMYYGETNSRRFLAVIVTDRAGKIRVVTAYDLGARQKQEYFTRRMDGE